MIREISHELCSSAGSFISAICSHAGSDTIILCQEIRSVPIDDLSLGFLLRMNSDNDGGIHDDGMISKEPDGSFNEEYCKWCYTDGEFAYKSKDTLLDYLPGHQQ